MKHKSYIYIVYIVLALGILLIINLGKSVQLKTLENSISVIQLTTGHEVKRYSDKAGSALGKPVYAEVLVIYEPIGNYTKKDVFDEIVAILKTNNWKDEGSTVPDYFRASLQQGESGSGHQLSASVAIFLDKDRVSLKITDYNR